MRFHGKWKVSLDTLKGQCHDIQWFFALFCGSKNGGCSRKCRGRQTWKLGLSRGLAASPAGYWQCSEPTTSRARVALLRLSTATGSTFVFRLRGPGKVISPSSRFKISGDGYIDIDSLFSCFVLRAFRSLLRRSRRREHGWLGDGIGCVVAAPFAGDSDDVCPCEGKCAERGTRERERGRDVDIRADRPADRLYCGIRTVRDKNLKTQDTHLW